MNTYKLAYHVLYRQSAHSLNADWQVIGGKTELIDLAALHLSVSGSHVVMFKFTIDLKSSAPHNSWTHSNIKVIGICIGDTKI